MKTRMELLKEVHKIVGHGNAWTGDGNVFAYFEGDDQRRYHTTDCMIRIFVRGLDSLTFPA